MVYYQHAHATLRALTICKAQVPVRASEVKTTGDHLSVFN